MAERPGGGRAPKPALRKALLGLALVASAAGLSRFRAGPAGTPMPDPALRLASAIAAATGLEADPASFRALDSTQAPAGAGDPLTLFFAARAAGEPHHDLFRVDLRAKGDGTPLALGPVTNLTRTPDGEERILDAAPGCLLYANGVDQRTAVVVLLERGPAVTEGGLLLRILAALSAWQTYGTFESPRRLDLVLTSPASELEGRCGPTGAELRADGVLQIQLDAVAGTLTPEGAGRLLTAGPPSQDATALLADALRASPLVGQARVMALEAALFDARDWWLRLRHGLFPTAEDRLPVAPSVKVRPPQVASWPPPAISPPQEAAIPGEGEWSDPLAGSQTEPEGPLVLRTFLRVDPERPYERVQLFAFDARRLGLHFVGGTRDPRSTTGERGQGSVPADHRDALVAAFNGGFKVEHGAFGAVEGGRVLVPPQPGLATVAMDASGRARFGVWDLGPELPVDTVGLRQNLPPLLAGGVVNPQRMHNWGQLVSRLDESQTPRSALGVTVGGVLLFGWGAAASAESLGEAMRRAGAQFAMHLDLNPGHTGLELYTPTPGGEPEARPGAPEMDFRERRWLATDTRDFFYLTRIAREQRPTADPQDLGVATPEGPDAPVRLWRLDAVRPQAIPGLAEPAPAARGSVPPRTLKLPAAPVFWVDAGVRAAADPPGLVVGGRIWRSPLAGWMTLTVDADGAARIAPWPELGEVARFPELIQGRALVADGRVVETDLAADGETDAAMSPLVALGQDERGRLLVAVGGGTTPVGVARALREAGAMQALRLAERPTPEAGRTRFFQLVGDRLFQSDRPAGRQEPADLRPRAGLGLVFTPRTLPPRARVVTTFRTEAK